MNNTGVTGLTAKKKDLTAKKKTLSMRMFGPRNSAYAVNLTYETYRQHIYIYHAKSRLNTPVWGSLRLPNYFIGTQSGNQILNGTNTMSKIIDVFRKKWLAKVSDVGQNCTSNITCK